MKKGQQKSNQELLQDEQAKNALAWFLNEVHLFQRHRRLSPETTARSIFFSYAWEEPVDKKSFQNLQNFLRTLKQHFDNAGLESFLDLFSMVGHIEDRMSEGIDESNLIILMGTSTYGEKTKQSSASNVRKEFEYALEKIQYLKNDGRSKTCVLFPLLVEGKSSDVFHRLGRDCMIWDASPWFNVGTGYYQMQEYIKTLSALEPPGLLPLAFRLEQVDYPDQVFKSSYRNTQALLMQKIEAIYKPNALMPAVVADPINIREISFENLKIDKDEDKLGEGSFGVVYEGQWEDTPVAVKEMSGTLTQKTAQYLQEEATLMTRANGPYVVRAYGVALKKNKREQLVRAALVMELMVQGSLHQLLHNGKDLPWDLRVRIARGIAQGLRLLHGDKILHRDLKSHNVLLNDRLEPKLSDFGLAQTKDSSRSSSRTVAKAVGTRAWMAPELFVEGLREIPYSEYSDIYALGVLFWEIAARALPYKGRSESKIEELVLQGTREPLPSQCPEIFGALIQGSWKQTPEQRAPLSLIIERLRVLHAEMQPVKASDGKQTSERSTVVEETERSPNQSSSGASALSSQASTTLLDLGKLSFVETKSHSVGSESGVVLQFSPHSARSRSASPQRVSSVPHCDPQLVSEFLDLVAQGWQDKAEAMIQKTPALLLARGTINDLSGRCSFQKAASKLDATILRLGNNGVREFRNMTAFEYALWALDMHMAVMLRKALDQHYPGEAALQASQSQTGAWVSTQGVHAGPHLKRLIDALQVYVDNYSPWTVEQCKTHWIKQVGGAQLLLPMHVLNEYCHPTRSFEPCPDFSQLIELPRSRKIAIDKDYDDLLSASWNNGSLGSSFGILRGAGDGGGWPRMGWGGVGACCVTDLRSVTSLFSARTQQRDQLITDLSNTSSLETTRRVAGFK